MQSSFVLEDFLVDQQIGQGAYGQIYKAIENRTGTIYALKAMNRKALIKMKKQQLAVIEKNALLKCQNAFTIKLFGTFKDDSFLYFVFELATHGDLAEAVNDVGKINVDAVKYLTAQILTALIQCHQANIIHRDLKPENILLDERNHIKLTDFGTAMIIKEGVNGSDLNRSSIVGTPEFVAPELLTDGQICFESDLWALGCTICNLLTGKAPFEGENMAILMENISSGKYSPVVKELPKTAKSLIDSLLCRDPKKRLGYGEQQSGYPSIKKHPFFSGVDWNTLEDIQMPAFAKVELEDTVSEGSLSQRELKDGETVVLEAMVERKRLLSWAERMLVLTSNKRILVFNAKTQILKREIDISKDTAVSVSGKDCWVLKSGKTEQMYRSRDGQAALWVATIMREMMKK